MGSRAKFRVRVSEVIEFGDVEGDMMGGEKPTEHRLDLRAEAPIIEEGDIVYRGDEATRGGCSFGPTEFVESILEVGRGDDQVGGGG